MGGACVRYGGEVCAEFGGKPERMKPPGRPRHRWEDKNKIWNIWWDRRGLDWSGSEQRQVKSSSERGNEHRVT